MSHHSAILRYSNLYSAFVYALGESVNLKSLKSDELYHFMRLEMVIFSKSDHDKKNRFSVVHFVHATSPALRDSVLFHFVKEDRSFESVLKYCSQQPRR